MAELGRDDEAQVELFGQDLLLNLMAASLAAAAIADLMAALDEHALAPEHETQQEMEW